MELETIKQSIHEIRGMKVIFDYELAKLYEVETKYLKRSVRNNLNRFPSDFMFELTPDEWLNLRCKFSTSSWGGQRYPPFAFTEQGVAMLSGLLNSLVAIDVNISIMRAFVMIREFALTYQGQPRFTHMSAHGIYSKFVRLSMICKNSHYFSLTQ